MFKCSNQQCKKDNPGLNVYCSYCGQPLEVPKSWVVAGGNERRNSFLGGPYTDYLRINEIADHGIPIDNSSSYNLPHPIMAGHTYWTIDTIGNKLKGYPIQLHENHWHIGPAYDLPLPAVTSHDFSSTPAFDGVCLNLLVGGQFKRLLVAQGRFAGKTLKDNSFKETQKAAPLFVSIENTDNPYRGQRFWIIPLAREILVVDITVLGEEDFHVIPWENEDGEDEMRSPVAVGNQVYFVTQNGRLFILPLEGDLDHLKRNVKKLVHAAYLEDHYCLAPAALGHYIVFEVMTKHHNDQYQTPYHERGVAAFNCHTRQFKWDYFEAKQYKSREEFDRTGHLPCLTDGEAAYLPQEGNGFHFSYFIPEQGLKPRKLDKGSSAATQFSILDSIAIEGRLYYFDYAKRRVLTWRLPEGTEFNLVRVPGPPSTENEYEVNLRPPISYGRNLVLFLDRHLCFISV